MNILLKISIEIIYCHNQLKSLNCVFGVGLRSLIDDALQFFIFAYYYKESYQ